MLKFPGNLSTALVSIWESAKMWFDRFRNLETVAPNRSRNCLSPARWEPFWEKTPDFLVSNPFEQYANMLVKIGSSPQFSGWTFQKYVSCHHLVLVRKFVASTLPENCSFLMVFDLREVPVTNLCTPDLEDQNHQGINRPVACFHRWKKAPTTECSYTKQWLTSIEMLERTKVTKPKTSSRSRGNSGNSNSTIHTTPYSQSRIPPTYGRTVWEADMGLNLVQLR